MTNQELAKHAGTMFAREYALASGGTESIGEIQMVHIVYTDNTGKKGGRELEPPLDLEKRSNMDDRLIVERVEDVLVGTSIPYNYENSRL